MTKPNRLMTFGLALAVTAILSCHKANQAPQRAAVPSGPATGVKDALLTFSSSAVDPEDDEVGVRFDWGDGDTSDWSDWAASGRELNGSHAYGRSGAYAPRAQARDIYGLRSSWSDPLTVTISNPYAPGAPSRPRGPGAGGRWAVLPFTAVAVDSGGDSLAIRFDWGDGDTSDWSGPVVSGESVTLGHAYQDSGTYAVRAQARDEEDAESGWSDDDSITITTLRWEYRAAAPFRSSPAIYGGRVYVGYDKFLVAFDTAGSPAGSCETDGVTGSPAIGGTPATVYVGSEDGFLYALDPDCSLRWRYRAGGAIHSSPAVGADGTAYVGADDGCLYAVGSDGMLRWRYQAGGPVRSSPAVAGDGTIYFGSDDSCLYAVNADSSLRWRCPTGGAVTSSPAIGGDGTVYIGCTDNYFYAVSPDGALCWLCSLGGAAASPAIDADGTIYVGSDSSLCAITSDGALLWRLQTGGEVLATPAIASDGTVYVGSGDGYVYGFTAAGVVRWHYLLGPVYSSAAITEDATMYVGSDDGSFRAIWCSGRLAASPWPKFRHDEKNTGRVGGR